MLTSIGDINWIGVILATISAFIFGGVWFTVIVSKLYAVALGRQNLPPVKPAPIFIIGPAICSLIMTITSALLIRALNIDSIVGAATFGAVVGLGYHVVMATNIAINPNFPRPFLYCAINAPYFFLSSVIGCIILVAV